MPETFATPAKKSDRDFRSGRIDALDSVLSIVDIQEKFASHIDQWETMVEHTRKLIRAASLLEIPILVTEQYPKGLGRTVVEVEAIIPVFAPIEKTAFGCFGEPIYISAVEALKRKTLVLCGIETHVCMLQTALDALGRGYRVAIPIDATSSRAESNKNLAIERMRAAGATIASVEMIVMEWLADAQHPRFKEAQALIK